MKESEGERERDGERGGGERKGETQHEEKEGRMRGKDAERTRMMCACHSGGYRCPQRALLSLGSSLSERIDFISSSEHSVLL